MPSLTLNHMTSLLGTYIEPNGDFKASLNQVLARIYNMGTYRDLTVQYSLPVVNGCITLPDDADAVLHTMVDGHPAPVRSMWHDFKAIGFGYGADLTWGLIDSGFSPTLQSLPEAGITELTVLPYGPYPNTQVFNSNDGEEIVIRASNSEGIFESAVNNTTKKITFATPVTHIESIRFEGLAIQYALVTDASDIGTAYAAVGPDSGVTRYRRFRLNRSTDGVTTVHVLCKRAFQPLSGDNDIVYVGNVGALKHGLLARIAEDGADIERAEYHWQRCTLLLEEEANSSRGAALPRLNIDPFGTGMQNKLYQNY
jgi:hypothetical protein